MTNNIPLESNSSCRQFSISEFWKISTSNFPSPKYVNNNVSLFFTISLSVRWTKPNILLFITNVNPSNTIPFLKINVTFSGRRFPNLLQKLLGIDCQQINLQLLNYKLCSSILKDESIGCIPNMEYKFTLKDTITHNCSSIKLLLLTISPDRITGLLTINKNFHPISVILSGRKN